MPVCPGGPAWRRYTPTHDVLTRLQEKPSLVVKFRKPLLDWHNRYRAHRLADFVPGPTMPTK